MRAVLYARVSSNDRAKTGGENLADQMRLCREHATKQGYRVVTELQEDDRGASGATFDLPQLSRALELARDRTYDVLVVRELDRLSRDLAKQLIVEQELKQSGVAIEYVLYDFPDTPEGRLNKNLRAMLAEYEREKINQRMTRGRRRKAREGHVLSGKYAPFGYEIVERDGVRTLAVLEEEAKIVRMIFDWYIRGNGDGAPMGGKTIANKLTEMGIPTATEMRGQHLSWRVREPGVWAPSTVARYLGRETYAGTWHYCKESDHAEIGVEVPAIVDRETWAAAQERKVHNRRTGKRNVKHDYLMRFHLTCPSCEHAMHAVTSVTHGKAYPYYLCCARSQNFPCDNPWHYRARDVDALAWSWIEELTMDEGRMLEGLRKYQAEHEHLAGPLRERLTAIGVKLEEHEGKIARLLDLYLAGDFGRDVLDARKAALEDQHMRLLEQQAHVEAQLEEQAISDEWLRESASWARTVRAGVEAARDDFEKRRRLVETLGVQGELWREEDDSKWLKLTCVVGEAELPVASKAIDSLRRKAQPFVLSTIVQLAP